MTEINGHTVLIVLGLTVVTVITRAFFLFSNRTWTMPHWAQRGLQYAPIAALAAVVVPEVVMVNGHLMDTWKDARLYAGIVGALVYFWRKDVLFTIVAGMAVYMPLHMGLGW